MNKNYIFGLSLGLSLALGAVLSSIVVSDALKWSKRSNDTLQVKGYAEEIVRSDYANWVITVRSGRHSGYSQSALGLKKNLQRTLDFLADNGYSGTNVRVGPTVEEIFNKKVREGDYWRDSNEVEFVQLSNTIEVLSGNVEKIEKVSLKMKTLLEEGANIHIGAPRYHYTGFSKIKNKLLSRAAREAYYRARVLVKHTGSSVGSLVSVRQGVFQMTPKYSTDVSDYGYLDTSSIEKKVRAVATFSFRIGP